MWRHLLDLAALISGLAIGMVVNQALVRLNYSVLYPMPEGSDMNNLEQLNAHLVDLPTAGFLVVMAAHLGQAFVGGWVAARLSGSRPMLLAMSAGAVSLAGGAYMMTVVDGPGWLAIELPLYLFVAWIAGRLEISRRASASR